MKNNFKKLISQISIFLMILTCIGVNKIYASTTTKDIQSILDEADPYVDFSSDRSTWFFNIKGDGKQAFFDFYSPFDLVTKTEVYDPLVQYIMEDPYKIIYNGNEPILLLSLSELEKMYDPYFAYDFVSTDSSKENGTLYIRHTYYEKTQIDGFGGRSTKLLYQKHIWDLTFDVKNGKAYNGECIYTTYEPDIGGRNLADFTIDINTKTQTSTNIELSLPIMVNNDNFIVPASLLMEVMGKNVYISDGYLHIQVSDLTDVTSFKSLEDRIPLAQKYISDFSLSDYENIEIPELVVPDASNIWHSGIYETTNDNYTWADYMNDVSSGKRNKGWIWKSIYLASEDEYVDTDGNKTSLVADRIIPYNIYVPENYSNSDVSLVVMLHGGTGNENTATYRLMTRDVTTTAVDTLAEKYNYIILSPNGWTQNPLWREGQALNSFLTAFNNTIDEYNIQSDRIFLTGNSMGGKGTIEIAMRYPNMFRAIAATAPKLSEKVGTEIICSIEESNVYSIKEISDLPTMIVQGNLDTTTSFKVQMGSEEKEGMISDHIMPYLNNAKYVTVESGNHSHSYGATLPMIFDFFNQQFSKTQNVLNVDIVHYDYNNLNTIKINDTYIELSEPMEMSNNTVMISTDSLKEILGDEFLLYYIENYNNNPEEIRKYYTIVYKNQVINFMTPQTANLLTDPLETLNLYRVNMERYIEDGIRMSSWSKNPENLPNQPSFSAIPYEKNGLIYVPLVETLGILTNQKSYFKDVDYTHGAYLQIQELAVKNIINGVGNNSFNPSEKCSLAMALQVLYNIDNNNTDNINNLERDWYYKSFNWAKSNNILKDIEYKKPYDTISLYELLKLIDNYNDTKLYSNYSQTDNITKITRADMAVIFS